MTDSVKPLPLFIVGRARSGTTLLRNLLGGHSEIALTAHESHFVPGMVAAVGLQARFPLNRRLVDECVARFRRGQLYRKGVERREFQPTDDEIRAAVDSAGSWADLIRGLLSLYSHGSMERARYWGDKTPRYLEHLDLLAAAAPEARFLHIIRDPRDQALSVKAIWGKSVRRAAADWRREVDAARHSLPSRTGRYLEVGFERLVHDPEAELGRVTDWLGLERAPEMLRGAAGSDELGQMTRATGVDPSSAGGHRGRLRSRDEITIAALTGETARELGYDLPATPERRLSRLEERLLQGYDRAAVLRYHVLRRDGLRAGFATAMRWQKERP